MSDHRAQLALGDARLDLIEHVREHVSNIMWELKLCEHLAEVMAEPAFPFPDIPWATPFKLTAQQFGKALPLLIELQRLMKE